MRLWVGIALLGCWAGCGGTLKLNVASSESPPKRISVLQILTWLGEREIAKPGFQVSVGCLEAAFGRGIDAIEGQRPYVALKSEKALDHRPPEQFFQSLASYVPADAYIVGRGTLTKSARRLQTLSVRLISARTGAVLATAELDDLGDSELRATGTKACLALLTGKGS